ncbi:initiation-control protein YabA [Companilactobacillus sp. RD055328]|uniref:DNA replication initiation control protein YabA n=1 Tax=Companilactobacillus sp. RD055328 TaxID=2916634 RepID=UPI001FC7CEB6|nr:DNA replication initiation control protein YabA [Companilactobacillus sp. RD055328]GKQ42153.1 initiation-control protein YabA [Companilactobacillus sp. RD055328]
MAQKDEFQKFDQLVQQSQDLSKKLQEMKDSISALLIENAELKIENENLRNRLDADTTNSKKTNVTNAHQNLVKLYNKGYHICRPMYGAHRNEAEGCAFCLGILNDTDNKSKAN